MYLGGSSKNTISGNIIYNCTWGGINMGFSSNNFIYENEIKYCRSGVAIILASQYNQIIGNKLSYNNEAGVLSLSFGIPVGLYNNISWNILDKNQNGILLYTTNNTIVKGNIIRGSLNIGINVTKDYIYAPAYPSGDNLIYANYLENNTEHAINAGPNNAWDNGFIGNYWDNYTGNDRGDGIGDTMHFFKWGIDFLPIYEDPFHNGSKIHVDDTGVSARSWSLTSLMKAWCRGEGTEEIPYVIEDLIINGTGTGSGIIIGNSSVNCRVENCTVFNSGPKSSDYAGIKLLKTNYSTIINNNCSDNKGHGIYLDSSSDNNTIEGNSVNRNYGTGIIIGGNNNNISNNICVNNLDKGLTSSGKYNNISGNYFFNNTYMLGLVGIIDYGNYTILSENTLEKDNIILMGWYTQFHRNIIKGARLDLSLSLPSNEEAYSHTISDTNTVNDGILYYYKNEIGLTYANFTNAGQIILMNCNDSLISQVSISNNSGMELKDSYRNKILNVNFSDSSDLNIYHSHQNFITKCNFIECTDGVLLSDSSNNTIFDNKFENNSDDGIAIIFSNYNNISGNLILNCNEDGVQLTSANYTLISENTIYGNAIGINFYPYAFEMLAYNNITRNIIENNQKGMQIWASYENIFSDNIILNNSDVGIVLEVDTSDNQVFMNFFRKNKINADDKSGGLNNWNSSIIGNYWDNYTGVDNQAPFGIGDTTHSFDGIDDELPIYDKFAPIINIITPLKNEGIDRTAPDFTIYVFDNYTFRMWYTIDGGVNNITFTQNGTIVQYLWETLWDSLNVGDNITIKFYAEDKPGYISMEKINVTKSEAPPGTGPATPRGDDDDDDDDKEEFDVVEFFTSPLGLAIIGGSIVATAVFAIIKFKGSSKSRLKEIERIERLKSD
jgi:parallel beta-helix repeat protein